MAESRQVRLITKRTSVPGKIPTGTTGDESSFIRAGELASNLADHSLWGYDGTNVFEYGSDSFLGLTGGSINGDVFISGGFSATTISGGTILSGGTNLYDIFGTGGGTSGNIWSSSTGSNSIIANNGTGNLASGNYSIAVGGKNRAIGNFSSVIGGYSNTSAGQFTFVGNGLYNTAITNYSIVVGGYKNLNLGNKSFIGGGDYNQVKGARSSIVGGSQNYSSGDYSSIVGGRANLASGNNSFIGGGALNSATTYNSSIVGGNGNITTGQYSFIGGGRGNRASNYYSTIVGGYNNLSSGVNSFVGGGKSNSATTSYSSIVGGSGNASSGFYSFIAAGFSNSISGHNSAIVGGSGLTNPYNETLMTKNLRAAEGGGVIYSAGTDLYNIFLTSGSSVSAGSNIIIQQSGSDYKVSVSGSPIFNQLTTSGLTTINSNFIVTGNTNLEATSASTIYVEDFIQFNTGYTPGVATEGRMYWDNGNGTVSIGLHNNQVILQVGQETHYYVKNQSGATIENGKVVRADGTLGASGKILAKYMIANGTIPAKYTLGIATEDILNGDDGYVTEFGLVRGLDTTGTPYGETWNDGDILWVSPTFEGGLTNIEPQFPNIKIEIAIVVYTSASNGSIFVRPHRYPSTSEIQDIISSGKTNNSILQYNTSLSGYTNTTTPTFTSLSATTISGGTIYSGSTNIYNIFAQPSQVVNNVNSGSNITTGGTAISPAINLVASPSVNNLTFSGTAIGGTVQAGAGTFTSLSATTLSGGTILSGGTNLYSIFSPINLISNPTDDRVLTSLGTTNTANAEVNLRFNGSTLRITGTGSTLSDNPAIQVDSGYALFAQNVYSFSAGTADRYVLAGASDFVGNFRFAGIRYDRTNNVAKFGNYFNNSLGEAGYIAITSGGTVGIGIANATARFHVNNITTGATALFEDSSNPDSSPFIIDTNGLVGIGILTPTEKLQVSGNTTISGTLTISGITSGTSETRVLVSDSTGLIKYLDSSTLSGDVTRVQPGSNITTGGTSNLPVINLVASPSVNNLTFSGTAIGGTVQAGAGTFTSMSAGTLSGGTIYSGGTNLYEIFEPKNKSPYNSYVLTAGTSYTFTGTVNAVSINKAVSSNTQINLPSNPNTNDFFVVKDRAGVSFSYPITISGGTKTIDGNTSYEIKVKNKPSLTFLFDGSEYIII